MDDAKVQRLPIRMLDNMHEWHKHQAASNYLSHDPASAEFDLPPERSLVFADLDQRWIPALKHAVARPERGADVTDLGCGDGWSTGIVAKPIARRAPKPNRTCIAVEPIAGDRLVDKLNPVGLIRGVGFRSVRWAAEAPCNIILEARPRVVCVKRGSEPVTQRSRLRPDADFDHHHRT